MLLGGWIVRLRHNGSLGPGDFAPHQNSGIIAYLMKIL